MTDPIIISLLSVVAGGSAVLSAIVGMAGGIVLLSIMTFFMDLKEIVPVHGLVQLVSNSTRLLSLKKFVQLQIFIPTAIGLCVGTFISSQIIMHIENREVLFFLIAALIFYVLFKPKRMPKLIIPFWSFGLLAVVVGILNPLIGATGPIMAPFYLRDDLSKEQIVATKASAQAFGHLLKIPTFIYLGFNYEAYMLVTILMILSVIVGTRYGVTLLKRIDEKTFRFIFRTALFIAACRIIYKGLN